MWYSKLVVSCACLLLLHLENGAARATDSGPSKSLYAAARDLGLDAAGLEEIWRTGKPLVIRNEMGPDNGYIVTYTLSPDRRTINRFRKSWFQSSNFQSRNNFGQTDSDFFLDPFLNPLGTGSSQAYFENWARSFSNLFFNQFNGFYNPNNQSPPPLNRIPNDRLPNDCIPCERIPNERIPNERNPSVRPPNERPGYTPNIDESNSNDSQWVPVPDTTQAPSVPLPTRAPSNDPKKDTVIDDYLAKVDVTIADIKDEDGEYVTTIVDENGRILKAKFELVETKSQDGKQRSN